MESCKVLIIEDSSVLADVLDHLINRMDGWSVIGRCATCSDAEAMAVQLRPDLITLDLSLPDGDALDLLERLTSVLHIPVLVVSGSTYEGSPVTGEALARGADACFDKAKLAANADLFRLLLAEMGSAIRAGQAPARTGATKVQETAKAASPRASRLRS